MPLKLITAMSVVPPPMSTTMLPCGSVIGSPAPIAAAIGLDCVRHFVNGDDRRFRDDNAAAFGVNQRVGGAEVNRQVAGEKTKYRSKAHLRKGFLTVK